MTPPPEPEHSGLRPLSPWGEGYCRWCHFVVGLTWEGQLVEHVRGAHGLDITNPCKGSFTKPPKVTPYASRKAAFRVKSEPAWCPKCRQFARTTRKGGVRTYTWHSRGPLAGAAACPNYGQPVEG